jgi:hypothetical protein
MRISRVAIPDRAARWTLMKYCTFVWNLVKVRRLSLLTVVCAIVDGRADRICTNVVIMGIFAA